MLFRSGKVTVIASNVRKIDTAETKKYMVMSYDEAVKRLKNNQYLDILTSPQAGSPKEYATLYPGNKAVLNSVSVTESELAYLEDLPVIAQYQLSPYYIFRGTGTLENGYRVKILATVPATLQTVLGASTSRLLAQNTSSDSAQKQGELTFPTMTPAVTLPQKSCADLGLSSNTQTATSSSSLNSLFQQALDGTQFNLNAQSNLWSTQSPNGITNITIGSALTATGQQASSSAAATRTISQTSIIDGLCLPLNFSGPLGGACTFGGGGGIPGDMCVSGYN